MKKALALLTVFAMLFALAACGSRPDTPAPSADDTTVADTTVLALPDPAANVNPEEMDWGWNEGRAEPFEDMTSDIWYPAGQDGNNAVYMYFVNGHSAYIVENGEEKSAGWILSDDWHMIPDPEYTEFEFDIVFMDNFTLYDYISETYYTRGDQNEYSNLFIGKTFTCKTDAGRSMLLREDGTASYTYRGEAEECKWEVVAQRIIKLTFADYDDDFYVFYNADGQVEYVSESPYNADNAYVVDYPEK